MMRHIRDYHSRYIIQALSCDYVFEEVRARLSQLGGILDMLKNRRTIDEGVMLLCESFADIGTAIIRHDASRMTEAFCFVPLLFFTEDCIIILRIFLNYCYARICLTPGEDQLQAIITSMKELYILDFEGFYNWLLTMNRVWDGEQLLQMEETLKILEEEDQEQEAVERIGQQLEENEG